jgi:hypothetical protein
MTSSGTAAATGTIFGLENFEFLRRHILKNLSAIGRKNTSIFCCQLIVASGVTVNEAHLVIQWAAHGTKNGAITATQQGKEGSRVFGDNRIGILFEPRSTCRSLGRSINQNIGSAACFCLRHCLVVVATYLFALRLCLIVVQWNFFKKVCLSQ